MVKRHNEKWTTNEIVCFIIDIDDFQKSGTEREGREFYVLFQLNSVYLVFYFHGND